MGLQLWKNQMSKPIQTSIAWLALSSAIFALGSDGNRQSPPSGGQTSVEENDRLVWPEERDAYIHKVMKALQDTAAAIQKDYSGPGLAQKVEIAFRRHGGTGPLGPKDFEFFEYKVKNRGSLPANARYHEEVLQFKHNEGRGSVDIHWSPDDIKRPVKASELKKLDLAVENLQVYDSQSRSILDELIDLLAEDKAVGQHFGERGYVGDPVADDLRRARIQNLQDLDFFDVVLFDPLHLEKLIPVEIRLYAKCVAGLQVIDEIYLGVPTIVEAEFDPAFDGYTYDVEVSVGSRKVKMTAHRFDSRGRLFRTEPFIPTEAKADVGPIFDPPVPPDPNRSRP